MRRWGVAGGTLNNCTLSGNSADVGGGAYYGTLNNCTLTGNSADARRRGVLGHAEQLHAHRQLGRLLRRRGVRRHAEQLHRVLQHGSDRMPTILAGTLSVLLHDTRSRRDGNITHEPRLARHRIWRRDSPCVGAGSAAYVSGVDIDGEAWRNPPSIGARRAVRGRRHGRVDGGDRRDLHAMWPSGFEVAFTARIEGRTTGSAWDFGDGSAVTNRPYVSHGWTAAGTTPWCCGLEHEHPAGVAPR